MVKNEKTDQSDGSESRGSGGDRVYGVSIPSGLVREMEAVAEAERFAAEWFTLRASRGASPAPAEKAVRLKVFDPPDEKEADR